MNTLKNIRNQFGELLSREELKNVVGGGDLCVTDEDCAGGVCIDGSCVGEIECVPEKPCNPSPGIGEGEFCSVPSGKWGVCGYNFGIWGCIAVNDCPD